MNALEMNKKILSDPVRRKEVAYSVSAYFVIYLRQCKYLAKLPHVERVSILPENSFNLGYVRRQPFLSLEIEIKISFAGKAADYINSKYSESNDIEGFVLDELIDEWLFMDEQMCKLIQVVHGKLSEEEMEEKVEKYFVEVLNEVKLLWSKIENVAKKLLEVSVFEGDELTDYRRDLRRD
jgi:hypothetical protein